MYYPDILCDGDGFLRAFLCLSSLLSLMPIPALVAYYDSDYNRRETTLISMRTLTFRGATLSSFFLLFYDLHVSFRVLR